MSRRASSSPNSLWLLLAAVLGLCVVAGGFVLYGRVSDPYRTLSPLPVPDYLENANSLRGNVYKLEATVAAALDWSPTNGRLFSVESGDGKALEILPVLVPAQFNHVNIERGQRFLFKIEVAEKGVLRAQDVKKT